MKFDLWKLLSISLFLSYSIHSIAACGDYVRLHGLLNLPKKSWETTNVSKKITIICKDLPEVPHANLEITLRKKKSTFRTKIFRSLDGYWDKTAKDGKWEGGTYPLDVIEVNTLIPDWFKGSNLKIKDLNNNKILVEVKL